MSDKRLIMIGMVIGSTLGGWLPSLWGAGGFTVTAVVFGAIGGLAGIWAAWKLVNR
ncbi:MAG TPA: hypothetical protein VMJ70_11500 [Candidatus Sulfotelmatobacter sp.]|nr:hypothetical protein [Candidatus Sulfotelmatobacter sp.]